jgi:hypothetical protein
MFPSSHFFSGYLIGGLLIFSDLVGTFRLNFVLFGLVSMVPDLDAVWNRKIESHHQTFFQAPIFWITVSGLISLQSFELAVIVISMTLKHIITGYVTGRTIGITFLYSFSRNEYSLHPVDKKTASLDSIRPEKELLKKHLDYCLENKKLMIFELLLAVSGVISMFPARFPPLGVKNVFPTPAPVF